MFNYIAPYNRTGYGLASIGYAHGLKIAKEDFPYVVIGGVDPNDKEITSSFNSSLLENVSKSPNWNNPSFCFWHLHDIGNQCRMTKAPVVGMTTFEVDSLTPEEVKVASNLKVLATASKWGAKILQAYFPKKQVECIPHSLKYSEESVPLIQYDPEKARTAWGKMLSPVRLSDETLIVSSAGKYESRKGHPELIQACIELSKERPVVLIGFWFNPFIFDGYPFSDIHQLGLYPEYTLSGIKAFRKDNFILVLMPPTPTRQELHSALTKADIFASPSKGEGWDLPLFELMNYGMPCLATLNTAHLDFCNEQNVVPIKTDKLVKAIAPPFFDGRANWYEVTPSIILDGLKQVSGMKQSDLRRIGILARSETEKYTWLKSAKKIQSIIQSL